MLELISLHVPKCAGSALRTVLAALYGEEGLYLDYSDQVLHPTSLVNIDPERFARQFGEKREKLLAGKRAVHGHFYYPKYHDVKGALRITVLREPVDRLISHYFYWKTFPPRKEHVLRMHVRDNNLTIGEFARMPALRYFYTRRFFEGVDMAGFDLVADYGHLEKGMEKLAKLVGKPMYLADENQNAFEHYSQFRAQIMEDGPLMASLRDTLRDDTVFYEKYVYV